MNFEAVFSTPSLAADGLLTDVSGRTVAEGDLVDCYRNLNRANTFSIKQRGGEFKGLVSGYARAIVVANPTFVVGQKARERVVRESVRNVHSYVRGSFVAAFDSDILAQAVGRFKRATYSPYLCDHFVELERDSEGVAVPGSISRLDESKRYPFAILNGRDVFLLGSYPF